MLNQNLSIQNLGEVGVIHFKNNNRKWSLELGERGKFSFELNQLNRQF